jgi:plasmid maintenance system antidote protein VapI
LVETAYFRRIAGQMQPEILESASAELAIRLAAALGGLAESWLNMQVAYDLWHAQKKRRPKIERLPRAA